MKLVVGFITYNNLTAKYLPYFLPSLFVALDKLPDSCNYQVLVIDNSDAENNENKVIIKDEYPVIDFKWSGQNLGFSKAYNLMIKQAKDQGADYFLMLNPDMILEPDSINLCLDGLERDGSLGSIAPKIMSWDFNNRIKTDIIDTYGIGLRPGLRFFDVGQGEKAEKRQKFAPIGPSGAFGVYRVAALDKIKENGQYLDERIFMYKEDCDLVYRLFLAGWSYKCLAISSVYHDRSVAKTKGIFGKLKGQFNKSFNVRSWSFYSQHLLYIKFWSKQPFRGRIIILFDICKLFLFALIFDRGLLQKYPKI